MNRENADNAGQLKVEIQQTCCAGCGKNVEVEPETGLCQECLDK